MRGDGAPAFCQLNDDSYGRTDYAITNPSYAITNHSYAFALALALASALLRSSIRQ